MNKIWKSFTNKSSPEQVSPHKALVLMTDGVNSPSSTCSRVEPSLLPSGLGVGDAHIFTVGVGDGPSHEDAYLTQLAEWSKGRHFAIDTMGELESIYYQISCEF